VCFIGQRGERRCQPCSNLLHKSSLSLTPVHGMIIVEASDFGVVCTWAHKTYFQVCSVPHTLQKEWHSCTYLRSCECIRCASMQHYRALRWRRCEKQQKMRYLHEFCTGHHQNLQQCFACMCTKSCTALASRFLNTTVGSNPELRRSCCMHANPCHRFKARQHSCRNIFTEQVSFTNLLVVAALSFCANQPSSSTLSWLMSPPDNTQACLHGSRTSMKLSSAFCHQRRGKELKSFCAPVAGATWCLFAETARRVFQRGGTGQGGRARRKGKEVASVQ